jgi:trans-aconitate methyltransferase
MTTPNPIDLLFHGDMAKLGPGGDSYTRHVLRMLPERQCNVIVDAGCGTGRQTIVLAKELGVLVHAVDTSEVFLQNLEKRAADAGIERLVRTHCMSMQDIPAAFPRIDLLWSEGAAYNIGFANALTTWAPAIESGAFAVVSELCWLRAEAPVAVKKFFESAYPAMQTVLHNRQVAQRAGYKVLDTYTLPGEAWVEGYYDVLQPRATALLGHSEAVVRDYAAETLKEIEVFGYAEGSYGYVFYLLQRV